MKEKNTKRNFHFTFLWQHRIRDREKSLYSTNTCYLLSLMIDELELCVSVWMKCEPDEMLYVDIAVIIIEFTLSSSIVSHMFSMQIVCIVVLLLFGFCVHRLWMWNIGWLFWFLAVVLRCYSFIDDASGGWVWKGESYHCCSWWRRARYSSECLSEISFYSLQNSIQTVEQLRLFTTAVFKSPQQVNFFHLLQFMK